MTSGLLPQARGRPDKSLAHLSDNIGATEVAARLTGEGVRALTAVQDEESAINGGQVPDVKAEKRHSWHRFAFLFREES